MSDVIETDVLILGSGIAGCTTALTLADAGVAVTVATRANAPEESNTYWAQGGIIYRGENDSPARLAEDIERAGAGICKPAAVTIVAEGGPSAIERVLLARRRCTIRPQSRRVSFSGFGRWPLDAAYHPCYGCHR